MTKDNGKYKKTCHIDRRIFIGEVEKLQKREERQSDWSIQNVHGKTLNVITRNNLGLPILYS